MKKFKELGKKKIILIVVLAVAAVLIAVYLSFSIYFASRFGYNTIINGVDCSRKTLEQVEAQITKEIDSYEIKLEERGGAADAIKSTDIGLEPVFDGTLQKEMKAQSGFAWIVTLFKPTNIEVDTMVSFDEEKFTSVVDKLNCLDISKVTEPKDAYLSEYIAGTGYEVMAEVEGNKVDRAKLEELLKSSITNLQSKVSLEEQKCYLEPAVRSDDENLGTLAGNLNKYVQVTVTYEFGSEKEVLDGGTIHKWLSVDENQQITIDESQAAQFVAELAEARNTAGRAKNLATSYGTTVKISSGDYGWKIDQSGEVAKLIDDIKGGTSVSREPEYKQRANSFGANDYGDTYVEINLTAQHLYFYKNGSLIVESDFVSGNLAKGWDTPAGAYSITYTQKDAVLRGEGYASPVDYWMPFNGGVGMHDASWRSDFGGNYYKNGGSHGCVNMPHSAAKKVFENIKTGDAVLVYELAGTESSKAAAQDSGASVVAAISEIGDVSLDSGNAINNARSKYDALSEQGKGYVTNYDTLAAAEAVYADLLNQQAQQQADSQAKSAAQPVVDAINAIGEVNADSAGAISNARNQYNGLSDAAKGHVSNLGTLEEAERTLASMQSGQ